MKAGQRQSMKMKQKLSPQQFLLMQMIQLPVTSLEQRLKEELEKNYYSQDPELRDILGPFLEA